jgi:DNA invertase Pin-like site-specific DNA recombinase
MSEPKTEKINPDLKKTVKALMAKIQRADELKKELAEIEAELRKYNIPLEQNAKKGRKSKSAGKNIRVKIDEAEVIKFIGDKEFGYAEIADHFGKNVQTMKKWLDSNKKISKRKEVPSNPRSKVFYKVK